MGNKTTRHGGGSIDGPVQHPLRRRTNVLGGASSAGNNSETSSENEEASDVEQSPNPPEHAPTTDSHSSQKKVTGKGSDAPTTGGDTQETTKAPSAKRPTKLTRRKHESDDELADFD